MFDKWLRRGISGGEGGVVIGEEREVLTEELHNSCHLIHVINLIE
jgi:hypothetical protein